MTLSTHLASSNTAAARSIPLMTLENHQRFRTLALQDCSEFLWAIPKTIGDFFVHRYADCRMFVRAFSSMIGRTTTSDIDRRINEIFQLKRALEVPGAGRQAVCDRYFNLSSQSRNLFFYADLGYMRQFDTETDPAKVETIRQEILRECDRAICLQQTLTAVNIFYHAFPGGSLIFEQRRTGRQTEQTAFQPPPQLVPSNIDLNVPHTVPYVQDQIPAAVQQKADEIGRLKERFDALTNPPAVPDVYNDPVMFSIMTLPVFDASHPGVQNGLAALRAAPSRNAAAALNNHRTFRHTIEKDSLEGHIRAGTSWSPSKCPTCRHPEHGGIRRESLRIDTGLQDEILQFLRRATGG